MPVELRLSAVRATGRLTKLPTSTPDRLAPLRIDSAEWSEETETSVDSSDVVGN